MGRLKITETNLHNLVYDGILYDQLVGEWCEPGDYCFPSTQTDEIVVWASLFERGFRLPAFDFFRGAFHTFI